MSNFLLNYYQQIAKYPFLKKILFLIALSIPIIAINIPMLVSGNLLPGGDFDMQVQMTEAAKISILKYHQFPWWNPWVAGGVPLFGDPQFGLVTPQTLFSFITSSVMAWKLTVVAYLLTGFYGMLYLLNSITKANYSFNIFLSYIWLLGSFFVLRSIGGHFTFLLLTLMPLIILFGLKILSGKSFFILTLLLAYIFNAAIHYSTILLLVVGLGVVLLKYTLDILMLFFQKIESTEQKIKIAIKSIVAVFLALSIAVAVNIWRIYLSLEYIKDGSINRAINGYEKYIGLENGLHALFTPYQRYIIQPSELSFGTFEATTYIGRITLFVFLASLIFFIYFIFKNRVNKPVLGLEITTILPFAILAAGSFIIGLGGSFFRYLRMLPVFSTTRVSTRWISITAFCIIVVLAYLIANIYKSKSRFRHIFLILIILAAVEVSFFNFILGYDFWLHNNNLYLVNGHKYNNNVIEQEKLWRTNEKINYYALTDATVNNKGQIIADIALTDTRIITTNLCDQDQNGCSYVKSGNAKIIEWSPNYISIERTGPGKIVINSNSGVHWMVNGKYIYKNTRVVNTEIPLIFGEDSQKNYELIYKPVPKLLK